ncbi:hypothetical protein BGZ65_003516 [Modicella reniformis]|uniref:Uncharacterized protein n=1 Tax=Modicella reniformis TaxID=1440133 RepID=A0A9P6LTA2_9FUNG|nr:hypothetical protein BGZ65_003516 [Modicella reniformis]
MEVVHRIVEQKRFRSLKQEKAWFCIWTAIPVRKKLRHRQAEKHLGEFEVRLQGGARLRKQASLPRCPENSDDAETVVDQNLANEQVARKNARQDAFSVSQRVFTARQQTSTETGLLSSSTHSVSNYNRLREKYDQFCVLYHHNKEEQKKVIKAEKGARVQPHRASQCFGKFRMIDHATAQENTKETHLALPRTKISRQRPRYSFKPRTRIKQHDPPEVMKQHHPKPHKPSQVPETSSQTSATSNQKRRRKKNPKPITSIRKKDLLKAMDIEHPIVALDAGTLKVNAREAS